MCDMNDRTALLSAILSNPDDDTPRLVFADFLQENGEDDRAEFIRAQLLLEATRVVCLTPVKLNQYAKRRCRKCRVCAASDVERNVFRDHWRELVPKQFTSPVVRCRDVYITNAHDGWTEFARIVRGFTFSIECPTDDFLTHGRSILAQHPVTTITLPEFRVEIDEPGEGYGWQIYYYEPGADTDISCSLGIGPNRADMIERLMRDVSDLRGEFA